MEVKKMKNKLHEILGMLAIVCLVVGFWGGLSMLIEFVLVLAVSFLVIGIITVALPNIFIGE